MGSLQESANGSDPSLQMCELLLQKGATVNHSDKRDRRPLHWAASRDHDDVARLLLRRGADLDPADKDGFTPLHAAAAAGAQLVVQGQDGFSH